MKFDQKYEIRADDPVAIVRLKSTGEPINITKIPDHELPESLLVIKRILLSQGDE